MASSSTISIFASGIFRPLFSQRKIDCRAFSRLSLRPYFPFVSASDPFDSGEADSRSRELFFGMEPLEGPKHALGMRRIESGAVVPDKKNSSFLFRGNRSHKTYMP